MKKWASIFLVVILASTIIAQDLPSFIFRNTQDVKEKKGLLLIRDGPTELTEKFIAILEKEGVRNALFCLIGKRINEKTAKYVKLIKEKGFEICNQGFLHKKFSEFTNVKEAIKDIRRVVYRIKKFSGVDSKIAWAPFADLHFNFVKAVRANKIPYIVIPSLHSNDIYVCGTGYCAQEPHKTEAKILANVKPYDIILIHEIPQTFQALSSIIIKLKEKGYEFISAKDYIKWMNSTKRSGIPLSAYIEPAK